MIRIAISPQSGKCKILDDREYRKLYKAGVVADGDVIISLTPEFEYDLDVIRAEKEDGTFDPEVTYKDLEEALACSGK